VTQTAALYQLQTIDTQIDALRARLAEVDRLLNENEEVRQAQAAHDAAQQNLSTWKIRLKDLELEREQLREQADAAEKRLYSGKVLNPREMTDLQDKLAELRRRHESLEDPAIEALLEIEEGTAAVESTASALQTITARHAETLGALAAERETKRAEYDRLRTRAEEVQASIEPAYVRQYRTLRKRAGGLAVAAINTRSECSACGVQLTSRLAQQVRHGEVLTCPTCNRILYHP
jgi:hypothetical protein